MQEQTPVINDSKSAVELSDNLRLCSDKSTGPAVKAIIAINCIFFAMMLLSAAYAQFDSPASASISAAATAHKWIIMLLALPGRMLTDCGANTISDTILRQQYWRLITSAFLHLNLLHLAMNMYVLWDFNRSVEKFYGSAKFVCIYLMAAAGASITSLLFIDPANISVGASGAVFGCFGALVAFLWTHRPHFPKSFIRLYKKIFFVFFVYSIACAYVFKDMDTAAHAGGFLVGLWTALCIMPIAPGVLGWRRYDLVRLLLVAVVLLAGVIVDDKEVRAGANLKRRRALGYDRMYSVTTAREVQAGNREIIVWTPEVPCGQCMHRPCG